MDLNTIIESIVPLSTIPGKLGALIDEWITSPGIKSKPVEEFQMLMCACQELGTTHLGVYKTARWTTMEMEPLIVVMNAQKTLIKPPPELVVVALSIQ